MGEVSLRSLQHLLRSRLKELCLSNHNLRLSYTSGITKGNCLQLLTLKFVQLFVADIPPSFLGVWPYLERLNFSSDKLSTGVTFELFKASFCGVQCLNLSRTGDCVVQSLDKRQWPL